MGAEGTLGLVTGVAIQCPPRSSSVQVAFMALPSFAQAQKVLPLSPLCLPLVLVCWSVPWAFCLCAALGVLFADMQSCALQLLRMARASLGEILRRLPVSVCCHVHIW